MNVDLQILEGDVIVLSQRDHIFTTPDALCDFVLVFKIKNYNVRYGQLPDGRYVYQLVYQTQEN